MSLSVRLSLVCVVLASAGPAALAEDDPVEQKLTSAKAEYERTVEKARAGLLADLRKREDVAQKAGDLKAMEKAQAETKAFEDRGLLPTSVSVKPYESQLRTARARMEDGYLAAIRQYTKDGQITLAKSVQQELDEFKLAPLSARDLKPAVDLRTGDIVQIAWLAGRDARRWLVADPEGDRAWVVIKHDFRPVTKWEVLVQKDGVFFRSLASEKPQLFLHGHTVKGLVNLVSDTSFRQGRSSGAQWAVEAVGGKTVRLKSLGEGEGFRWLAADPRTGKCSLAKKPDATAGTSWEIEVLPSAK